MCRISQKPKSNSLIVFHPLWLTNGKPTKLNNIKWNSYKSDSTRGSKGGVEVKIPQYPFQFVFFPKNPSISLLLHNPQYSEVSDLSKSLAFDCISQSFKWDNHHISSTPRPNLIHISYIEELMPKLQCYWPM